MDKTPYPKAVSAIALALCAYLAHYEFESIKNDQKADRQLTTANAEAIARVQSDVRVLLERTPAKLANWQEGRTR